MLAVCVDCYTVVRAYIRRYTLYATKCDCIRLNTTVNTTMYMRINIGTRRTEAGGLETERGYE